MAQPGAFGSVVKLMVQEIHQVISPVSPGAIIRPKSSTGWADLDLWTIEDQYHIWVDLAFGLALYEVFGGDKDVQIWRWDLVRLPRISTDRMICIEDGVAMTRRSHGGYIEIRICHQYSDGHDFYQDGIEEELTDVEIDINQNLRVFVDDCINALVQAKTSYFDEIRNSVDHYAQREYFARRFAIAQIKEIPSEILCHIANLDSNKYSEIEDVVRTRGFTMPK